MQGSPVATTTDPKPAGWRQSPWLALAEFSVFALIFLADKKHLIPVSETPFLLLFAWIALRVRGLRWRHVGLARPRHWPRVLAFGLGLGLLMEALELFVSQPLLIHFTGKQPDLSDFQAIHGNVKLLLLFVVLSWTLAAFGEEMVWRGYLMNRVADLGGRTRLAWAVSLIAVHVMFGFAHSYQGITGILDEGLMGLLLGLIYLGAGRNLWVPIIAHGISDTTDFLLIFLGLYPGLSR